MQHYCYATVDGIAIAVEREVSISSDFRARESGPATSKVFVQFVCPPQSTHYCMFKSDIGSGTRGGRAQSARLCAPY